MRRAAKVFVVCLLSVWFAAQASAAAATPTTITVGPTPPPTSAPGLIITSIAGSSLPDFIELYNQNDGPYDLSGWSVIFTVHDVGVGGCADVSSSVVLPQEWLLSRHYLTLERTSAPNPASTTIPFTIDTSFLAGCVSPQLASISIIGGSGTTEQSVVIPLDKWSSITTTVAQHKQRGNSPGSTRAISGDFNTDYKIVTGTVALNSDPLYTPPTDTAGLQILEILPNARDCSPLDTDPTCGDYIKFFNPTDQAINLALYRVRIGAKGQSESVTNTFTWGQMLDPSHDELLLPPGQYFMLTTRSDGQPISITDTGNYVWLEDAYGTTIYEPLVGYPDASSTTKTGYAWGYDGASWQWTSAPQPNAPNYFPPPPVVQPLTSSGSVSVSVLKPCAVGQYRNPDTNRCRSVITATTALTPCNPGQERNPDTNRCRSIVTASTALAPCQPGWERNPDTNRCRKSTGTVAGAATTAVKDVTAPMSDSPMGWYVATIAVAAALAYAAYEWRQEVSLAFAKSKAKAIQLLPERFVRRRK